MFWLMNSLSSVGSYMKKARRMRAFSHTSVTDSHSIALAMAAGFFRRVARLPPGSYLWSVANDDEIAFLYSERGLTLFVVVCGSSNSVQRVEAVQRGMAPGLDAHILRTLVMSLLSKHREKAAQSSARQAADEACLGEGLEGLTEYLISTRWPDGKPRQVATLTIFADEGLLKASLNDRATEQILWASASDLSSLLEALELLLQSECPPWRDGTKRAGKDKRS